MIKLTVYINGESSTIDRDLIPVDSTGRQYDHLINERDENGIYKIDHAYYLELNKTEKLNNIHKWYNDEIIRINGDYTKEEIETFYIQEKEAREYLMDSTSSTPFIDAILSIRNTIRKDVFIEKILEKAELRRRELAQLFSLRHLRLNSSDKK